MIFSKPLIKNFILAIAILVSNVTFAQGPARKTIPKKNFSFKTGINNVWATKMETVLFFDYQLGVYYKVLETPRFKLNTGLGVKKGHIYFYKFNGEKFKVFGPMNTELLVFSRFDFEKSYFEFAFTPLGIYFENYVYQYYLSYSHTLGIPSFSFGLNIQPMIELGFQAAYVFSDEVDNSLSFPSIFRVGIHLLMH